MKQSSTTPPDTAEILDGVDIPIKTVRAYFKAGNWDSEEHLVAAIRRHLFTSQQYRALSKAGLTIEDMLNGRYKSTQDARVRAHYHLWNTKLGFHCFGSNGHLQGTPYPAPPNEWTDDQIQEILDQVDAADFVEADTMGQEDMKHEGLKASFRWLQPTDRGVELRIEGLDGLETPECEVTLEDLRRMRVVGNSLFFLANEGENYEPDDGEEEIDPDDSKFEIQLTLYKRQPLNLKPPARSE